MSFDLNWERTYSLSEGKHLNKYPYGLLVTYFYRNLKRLPDSGKRRVLELGCGAGNNMPLFLNEGFTAYGIDGSPSAIQFASAALKQYERCHLSVMNLTKLKFEEGSFELVIDRQSVYANVYKDIQTIFGEVSRVLLPNGIFISFLYNTKDYHYLKATNGEYAKQIEKNTFEDFAGGTFQGTGKAHFFTKDEVTELCSNNGMTILSLCQNTVDQIEPAHENRVSEFILVAQKNSKQLS